MSNNMEQLNDSAQSDDIYFSENDLPDEILFELSNNKGDDE